MKNYQNFYLKIFSYLVVTFFSVFEFACFRNGDPGKQEHPRDMIQTSGQVDVSYRH